MNSLIRESCLEQTELRNHTSISLTVPKYKIHQTKTIMKECIPHLKASWPHGIVVSSWDPS